MQEAPQRSAWDRRTANGRFSEKPLPDGFAETFVRHGWRGVETFFGARTSCNKRWIDEAGRDELLEQRQRYREALRQVRNNDWQPDPALTFRNHGQPIDWTPEMDDSIRTSLAGGSSLAEAAEWVGVSDTAAARRADELAMPRRRYKC